ncbi:MAG: GumC family protein [Candidatus Eiseniibacteriota bacterium]
MSKSDEIDLRSYALVLRRRQRLVWAITGGCLLLALIVNLMTSPVYQTTAVIEVRKDPGRSPLTGEAIAADQWQSDNIAVYTAAELITNRTLLRQVVETLDHQGLIPATPGWFGMFHRHSHPASPDAAEAAMDAKIDWLVSIVSIKPVRDTRLVNVVLEHTDPAAANRIDDTLVDAFVSYQVRQRADADSVRFNLLTLQMSETAKRIHALERNLNNADEAGVPVLQEEARQLTDAIASLNESYVKLQTDRLAAAARLARVREMLRDSLTEAGQIPVQSDVIDELWRNLLARQTELARAKEVYRDGHPKIQMLTSEIASIRANIRAELTKTVASLDQEYRVLQEREKSVENAISQRQVRLRQVNVQLSQQTTLQSDAKSTHDLYDLMSTRIQEDQVSGAVRYPLVSVVQRATADPRPVRPRKLLNLMLALLVGLLSGAGTALLLEYLRRTIRTPSEAMEQLELPVLGIIPKHS